MKRITLGVVICLFTLSGCTSSPINNLQNESKKAAPQTQYSITERLSGVMKDLQQSEKIYIDSTMPKNSRYLLLDKDELTSGMDWLGYALIENITDDGGYSIGTDYFLKKGQQPGLKVELLNEPPVFNWSFNQGTNLSADFGKVLSGSVIYKESYIYEFVISKIADFKVEKSVFDSEKFNAAIFVLYRGNLKNDEKPSISSFDNFKKSYGVARGGSLYDVIINEYKSTNIDGEADIVGLVKASGGFYKKTGGGGKKTIFKLFYASPSIDVSKFEQAIKITDKVKSLNQKELYSYVINPPNVMSPGDLNTLGVKTGGDAAMFKTQKIGAPSIGTQNCYFSNGSISCSGLGADSGGTQSYAASIPAQTSVVYTSGSAGTQNSAGSIGAASIDTQNVSKSLRAIFAY